MDAPATKTLMTKGAYARYRNRAPSAVSNWISEGKISPEAIEGEGQRAKIWVERADLDLLRSLDPDQQDRQPAPIVPTPSTVPVGLDDIARRRKADADAAELAAEERRRKIAADSGRWVEAAEAKRIWAAELTRIKSDLEVFVTNTLAVEIAGQFQLEGKAVAVACREAFRSYCEAVADDAATTVIERVDAMREAAE